MKHSLDHATARVFFALWPTATGRAQLAAWRAPLKHLCGGRAMRGETLHITLIFIGNVELHGLAVLKRAAQEISGESFELCFDEARYWGHNHIVYAAPRHVPPQLLQLAAALEERLAAHRFEFDRREYQPHGALERCAKGRPSATSLRPGGIDTAAARDAAGMLENQKFRAGTVRPRRRIEGLPGAGAFPFARGWRIIPPVKQQERRHAQHLHTEQRTAGRHPAG